ncbi:NRAMP family divalent metal transporter [Parendozoicomonas haliclonae]|uniref:Divalent metal cation transporter MntH n=1 Tax=Parendozoicomonas haliclonae TaxID=1960125 RepID=A0A1X7AFL5_9GAMM|nr:divalent metal cation transporter [Parendozoicomonas haliclonae]SMA37756.1 Divalent metal cation transporter MntH [Parendozoicomonas haliclonae]
MTTQTISHDNNTRPTQTKPSLLNSLGPGIMMAAAAIGGSHLIASTKAGAIYGWQLVGLIILVNIFKYPFFQYGARYSAATDESLVRGYARMGQPWLLLFLGLNAFASVVNIAALLGLTSALLGAVFPGIPTLVMAGVVISVCLLIVLRGHYHLVDGFSKWIVVILSVVTVAATLLAFTQPSAAPAEFVAPDPWVLGSLAMLISLMGWMPAPVEVSAMTSLWGRSKAQEDGPRSMKTALLDMNVGYIGTTILALFFVALGAQVMHGSGIELAKSGAAFSQQLADMYASVMGDWSRWLVIIAAVCCIFSSLLTCVDGYSRVNKSAWDNLHGNDSPNTESPLLALAISAAAITLVTQFPGSMLAMLEFAMIAAFLTTPVFALLNYRLMNASHVPEEHKPGRALTLLSQAGLIFLFGFAALFIWWKWMM